MCVIQSVQKSVTYIFTEVFDFQITGISTWVLTECNLRNVIWISPHYPALRQDESDMITGFLAIKIGDILNHGG